MAYTPSNIIAFASTRETSNEVALAIFEIAAEGDEARLWANPSDAEKQAVVTRAWELAIGDEDTLHWGNEKLVRS